MRWDSSTHSSVPGGRSPIEPPLAAGGGGLLVGLKAGTGGVTGQSPVPEVTEQGGDSPRGQRFPSTESRLVVRGQGCGFRV